MSPPRADLRAIGRFVRVPRVVSTAGKQRIAWGRLLLVTFLGEARKVTGPARPLSALVVHATCVWNTIVTLSLALSPQGRGDQMRSWFDKLTTNGEKSPSLSMRPNSGARRAIPPTATTTHPHPRRLARSAHCHLHRAVLRRGRACGRAWSACVLPACPWRPAW